MVRAMAEPLLALNDVRAGYGDAVVLDGISLEVPEHGSLAVLGRNGVGKSTLLLTIMGATNVARGTVRWRGEDITARRANMGNQLSGGEQQMLATARALMTNPALLLLDEPLEGLAPIIVEELVRGLRKMIVEEGTAVILVEQHAEIALSLTEHAVLLERGAIVHRARSQDLLKDHATLDRYIGLRVAEGKPVRPTA